MTDLVLCSTNRVLVDAELLLSRFLDDPTETGTAYLDYRPTTPPDRLVPEDLAVTLLMNSFATGPTFISILKHGPEVTDLLASIPDTPLEESTPDLRSAVVDLISAVGSWPWVKVSVATKLLHKKRPSLVPILDNRAIFGALLWPEWEPPERESRADSVDGRDRSRVAAAVEAIYCDLVRTDNETAWLELAEFTREHHRRTPSRIESFDMIWWRYFRDREPPPGRSRSSEEGGVG